MSFDDRQFRNGLGRFATGVAIVTTQVDGIRLGATINSFNSVSLSPPLVLFSLAKSALSLRQWRAAKSYAVHILGEGQIELSNRFASPHEAKWRDLPELTTSTGAPLLPNWLACFDCRPHKTHDGGDHVIFVGQVVALSVRAGEDMRPLLFYSGRYRSLDLDHPIDTLPEATFGIYGW